VLLWQRAVLDVGEMQVDRGRRDADLAGDPAQGQLFAGSGLGQDLARCRNLDAAWLRTEALGWRGGPCITVACGGAAVSGY
jgi:hypothetical protein